MAGEITRKKIHNNMKTENPPVLATRLLSMFLKSSLVEEVTGDLDERFQADLKKYSRFRSRLGYWIQVIHYLRPFALRGWNSPINSNGMLKNYWTITWRVMARQKMYSVINIGGFAFGITACLLIALYVRHEYGYDKHYVNQRNIYRIYRESTFRGEFYANAWVPAPLAEALHQFPEIEKAGHYVSASALVDGRSEIKRADRAENFFEDNIVYANQEMLEIIEAKFVSGNASRALTEPHTVVITQSKARKYFPEEDPLGKALVLNNDENTPFKITGVIADLPAQSHFEAEFVLSLAGHEFWPGEQSSWGASNYFDYVLLRPGTQTSTLEKKLQSLVNQYFIPEAIENGNDASLAWAKSLKIKLQPVRDLHFNRTEVGDGLRHADIRYIWLFAATGGFIIIIAAINFVNLSTARSSNRAKEVGLRKVVGSLRSSLIRQFLTESIVYCLVAFTIACALAYVLLPFFSNVVGTPISMGMKDLAGAPVVLAVALVIGILAGLYPAFYLSSFKPAQILKGKTVHGAGQSHLRSILVVCQYTISIVLIIGTLVIKQQMSYMMTKELGFDKNQVLVLQSTHNLGDRTAAFKQDLRRISGVEQVTVSGFLPVEGARRNGSGMWKHTKGLSVDGVDTQQWTVDEDYLQTLGLRLLRGRNFSPELASDSQAMIVNQELLRSMNISDGVGEVIVTPWRSFTIIGVVEDFHFESMRRNIAPVGLVLGSNTGAVSVRLRGSDIPNAVEQISALWKRYVPEQPMRYTFLDESYARMYDDVQRMDTLVTAFTVLAIIVATLGLFGLSAFTVEQRTREISIRRVLGATTASIINLLSGNFVRLVVISFVLAAPLAWFLITTWLQDYAYHVQPGWEVFGVAAVIALVIAVGTISVQSARAALGNTANNLRSE